ncbi:lipoate--protein ligase family protein, partial [Desertibacillus haloalkaliphilus]|nr:octanoyltransferase [Desertibacillus haloalkaliphilus]
HGSIILDIDEDKLFDLFNYSSERLRERMQKNFKNKAVAINALRSEPLTMEEAKMAFKRGFEKGLNIELEPYRLSEEEEEVVLQIARDRYEQDEWNFRK